MNKEKAMDKIRDEMAKKADHPGIAILGEYFTSRLQADENLAEKILEKGKTLEGAFMAIYDYAKANRGGKNYAFVPPEKGLAIACEYYKIPWIEEENPYFATGKPKEEEKEADALDLDALIGGL